MVSAVAAQDEQTPAPASAATAESGAAPPWAAPAWAAAPSWTAAPPRAAPTAMPVAMPLREMCRPIQDRRGLVQPRTTPRCQAHGLVECLPPGAQLPGPVQQGLLHLGLVLAWWVWIVRAGALALVHSRTRAAYEPRFRAGVGVLLG